MYDMIILGAGTAGLTCALYANRAGLNILLIEKELYGGQIINTPEIENYPSRPKVSGFEFIQTLYEQAVTDFQTEILFETVTKVELDGPVKRVMTSSQTYTAKTVVIATGAKHRHLGCEGEERLSGRGVSYCATCDGAFFRGKTVAVAGGGNTALQDANYLSNLCQKVYLIHRRDTFRATPIEVEQTLSKENVIPLYQTVIQEIRGENQVEQLLLQSTADQSEQLIGVDGVFIAIGAAPDNQLFSGQIDLDEQGYVIAGEDCKTNLPGVFVAGDTRTKAIRQLVTAAADGAVSAEMAAQYLRENTTV
jgi:thioredoxin reductase (NADPH)